MSDMKPASRDHREMAESKPIAMADLDWSDGLPRSVLHGDTYYSDESGLRESEHVFFQGCQLDERWGTELGETIEESTGSERPTLVVCETGFGTGLNFLMLWQAWLKYRPHENLRFISFEKYPLSLEQVQRCHQPWREELSECLGALYKSWLALEAGWQRALFEGGQIQLDVFHGDVLDAFQHFPNIKPDAWFLDGFSPSCNPDLWSNDIFNFMAQTAKPGTRFSTYTVAGFVRRGLKEQGFAVAKVKGFGRKREMLRGVFKDEL